MERKGVKILSHIEMIIVFIVTILSFIILNKYKEIMLANIDMPLFNSMIIGIVGTIFGILITSYSIFFGLMPLFAKQFRETAAYKKINFRYCFAIMSSLALLSLTFALTFFKKETAQVFFVLQLSLLIAIMLLLILLITYLFMIFRSEGVITTK